MYANDGGKWSGKTGGDSLVYVGVMKSYFLLSSSLSLTHTLCRAEVSMTSLQTAVSCKGLPSLASDSVFSVVLRSKE